MTWSLSAAACGVVLLVLSFFLGAKVEVGGGGKGKPGESPLTTRGAGSGSRAGKVLSPGRVRRAAEEAGAGTIRRGRGSGVVCAGGRSPRPELQDTIDELLLRIARLEQGSGRPGGPRTVRGDGRDGKALGGKPCQEPASRLTDAFPDGEEDSPLLELL